MTNKLFYFTGTGNALAIARTLSERLGDAEVGRMTPRGAECENAERIGLVFPVFGWGPPRMVEEFVRALRPSPDQYIFAVATCAGSPAATLGTLRRLLRDNGSDLDAGFTVRGDFEISFPESKPMAVIRLMTWLSRNDRPAAFADRVDEIARTISGKRQHGPETSNRWANALGSSIHTFAKTAFRKADRAFAATDDCIGCGICARVCPRENVRLDTGRPVWHHDCEFCYACIARCPKNAITLDGNPPAVPAHHPDVTLNDVVWR